MVFVIIVTYNGENWVDFCLGSLKNSLFPLTTVVIDNNSTDNTVNKIKNEYPEVIVIENPVNIGFGKANNIGITYALDHGCEYVFLLNQDACIYSDTISKLLEIHKDHVDYGILSPIHLDGSGEFLDKNFLMYISVNEARIIADKLIKGYNSNTPYSIPFINAAAWLISRSCILDVGGFDPIFPHYGEDEDYVRRVINKKYKVGVCASSFIRHARKQEAIDIYTYPRMYVRFLMSIKFSEHNFAKIFFDSQKRILIDTLKSILKLQFKHAVELIKISFKVFKAYEPIKLHLIQEKASGPKYLS